MPRERPATAPTPYTARRTLRDVFGAPDPLARAAGNQRTTQRGWVYALTPGGGETANFVAGSRHDRPWDLVDAGLRYFKGRAERFSLVLCSPVPVAPRLPGWAVAAQQTVYRRAAGRRTGEALTLQPVRGGT
ncbi:MAG: hypothetical protein ACT6S0_18920, partial [Roseateles sp.]